MNLHSTHDSAVGSHILEKEFCFFLIFDKLKLKLKPLIISFLQEENNEYIFYITIHHR